MTLSRRREAVSVNRFFLTPYYCIHPTGTDVLQLTFLLGISFFLHQKHNKKHDAKLHSLFMGLHPRATAVIGILETKRYYITGQLTYVNIVSWLLEHATQLTQINKFTDNIPSTHLPNHLNSPPKPPIVKQPDPRTQPHTSTTNTMATPSQPYRVNIRKWFHKFGNPQLGALVIHSFTSTFTSIDASGQEEARTIIRAELVAIHIALDKYKPSSHTRRQAFTQNKTTYNDPLAKCIESRAFNRSHSNHTPLQGEPRTPHNTTQN
jgi:hypothetical protein